MIFKYKLHVFLAPTRRIEQDHALVHVHASNIAVFTCKSNFLHKLARILLANKRKRKFLHVFACFVTRLENLCSHASNSVMHVDASANALHLHTRFKYF
jgi:hypothetical protein